MGILLIILMTVILDQSTKYWVDKMLDPHTSEPVIENVLHITYVQNPGAAFGIFPEQTYVFIVLTVVIIALMLVYFRHIPVDNFCLRLGLALGIAGAIGNLIDRIRFGYVIDFIDIRIWPVFNVADAAIVVGVISLLWGIITFPQDEKDRDIKGDKEGKDENSWDNRNNALDDETDKMRGNSPGGGMG